MHTKSIEKWRHDHTFGQEIRQDGESRTLIVILITAVTMVIEIAAGIAFGSMALLADGLHMGSHASALAIAAFAYFYTRRHAKDERFSFGTGKVNSLAAFASAVILVIFALVMAGESVHRFINPVAIGFDQAIFVAIIGLVVNGASIFILGGHGHSHNHADDHQHNGHDHKHRDQNLWAAYLHVLADALTSLLAIFALLGGKYLGQNWLDPFMGIVGAALVIRWSWGLLRSSSSVLLDVQAPEDIRSRICEAIEAEGDNRVADMHVWAVGPGIYAATIAVVSSAPLDPESYHALLPDDLGIVHATIEANLCADHR